MRDPKENWEESFQEQVARQAYNTSPVEAVVRNVAYYLRSRFAAEDLSALHFLEAGCGAGPNLAWLAEKGIRVSGIDIAPTALDLCRKNLSRLGHEAKIGQLLEAGADRIPFPDESFDGIVESCVFQHLGKKERAAAFREVGRLLKPGGVFSGYMLSDNHFLFAKKADRQLPDDPGTLALEEGLSKIYLTNIGLAHFFAREEFSQLLDGFQTIDPCRVDYDLPREEARRRGYDHYRQGMWAVYAVK